VLLLLLSPILTTIIIVIIAIIVLIIVTIIIISILITMIMMIVVTSPFLTFAQGRDIEFSAPNFVWCPRGSHCTSLQLLEGLKVETIVNLLS